MIKILHIYGDDDYAVVTWENTYQLTDAIQVTLDAILTDKATGGDGVIEFSEGCYAEVVEFDIPVPNKSELENFIDWIKDTIGDYDNLKNEDFFLVD